MRFRLVRYFRDNVVAFLALFLAMGGTSAYAVNTIRSTDIVDGEVKSADIANQSITSADVQDGAINTYDVDTILGVDILDNNLTGTDILDENLTGADVADHGLSGADIRNGSLGVQDIANNGVDSANLADNDVQSRDIANFNLNDEDVAQSLAVDFAATIGVVNAGSCVNKLATGLNAAGDHLLLTPSTVDANGALIYDARYSAATGDVTIHVCNFSNAHIDDGITHFNLLVFDAQ